MSKDERVWISLRVDEDTRRREGITMQYRAVIISNHGAEPKTEEMLKELHGVSEIEYLKHPEIPPEWTKEQVWELANDFINTLLWSKPMPRVAIVNGEYGFSTACVQTLERCGVPCFYPTSKRGATEEVLPDGSIKTVHVYEFVGFRRW